MTSRVVSLPFSINIEQRIETFLNTQSEEALPLGSFLAVCLGGIILMVLTLLPDVSQRLCIIRPACVFSWTIEHALLQLTNYRW